MSTAIQFGDLATLLTPVASRAGAAILELYGRPVAVDAKADDSPVTEADRRAEAIIVAALAQHWPDTPVIAEEAIAAGARHDAELRRFFLVDPLDGTREFIKQHDDFTVNIALIEDGTPRFGLVYAPARKLLYLTIGPDHAVEATLEATGSALGADAGTERRIRVRKAPENGLVAVTSRSHINPETEDFLATLPIVRRTDAGSSLKFALVARGDADVYPRLAPTMEWDTAAGQAVLAAAGGTVVTETGEALTCGHAERGFRNPGFIAWGDRGRA